MKAIWLTGLVFLLLMAAYSQVSGKTGEAVKGVGVPAILPAPAVAGARDTLPVWLSEYVHMHQNRDEDVQIHAVAGMLSCPE